MRRVVLALGAVVFSGVGALMLHHGLTLQRPEPFAVGIGTASAVAALALLMEFRR